MATLYTHKDKNIRKTWALMTLAFLAVIAIGWFLAYVYGESWILYIAVLYSVGSSVISYWFSDKIVIAMTRAKRIDEQSAPDLYHIVENLAITAGLPMPKVYIMNESGMNAFATGRNPENAAIAVTTGLLEALDKSELEGVLAHELSHIGNRDILVSTVAVIVAGTIALVSDLFFRVRLFGGGRNNNNGQAGSVLAIIGIVLMILAPIAATLIQLAISRKREYLADASGALITRYPEGLASALEKISQGSGVKKASKATAHLFIASPFSGRHRSKLFATHPPIEKRIEALLEGGNVKS